MHDLKNLLQQSLLPPSQAHLQVQAQPAMSVDSMGLSSAPQVATAALATRALGGLQLTPALAPTTLPTLAPAPTFVPTPATVSTLAMAEAAAPIAPLVAVPAAAEAFLPVPAPVPPARSQATEQQLPS